MKIIKGIFSFLWVVWGGFWFIVVILVLTPVYAVVLGIFGRKYAINCVWVNFHYASPFLLTMYLIRVKVFGAGKIDPKRTYVFVSNHRAQVDIPICGSAMPKPAKFLAKSEIKKVPVFGYMAKMLAIMVDRKSRESREKSVYYMVDELNKGNSLLIYPEGTRNRTDQPLREFKDGAFRIAIMAQVPVAVMTVVGTRELNDPRRLHLKPGTAKVYWSEPIETKGMTLDDLPALKERVKNEMIKYIDMG